MKMKKTFRLSVAAVAVILFSTNASAQWEVSGGVGISSSYLWAGNMYGAPGLTPTIETSYLFNDDISFDASIEGFLDFGNGLYLPGADNEPYNIFDIFVGFTFGNLSIYAGDEYSISSLRHPADNAHYWSAGADWVVSEAFPLTLSLYSIIYSDDDTEFIFISDDVFEEKQAHSTLITASYPFSIGESFEIGPELGFVPWQSPFNDYYDTKAGFSNFGLFGSYYFTAGDYSLPLSFNAGWNPYYESFYAAVSFGIEF